MVVVPTIAMISGLRLALLGRFDVLDVSVHAQQAMKPLQGPAAGGEIDTSVVTGMFKEPMAETPGQLQTARIDAGQLVDQQQQVTA